MHRTLTGTILVLACCCYSQPVLAQDGICVKLTNGERYDQILLTGKRLTKKQIERSMAPLKVVSLSPADSPCQPYPDGFLSKTASVKPLPPGAKPLQWPKELEDYARSRATIIHGPQTFQFHCRAFWYATCNPAFYNDLTERGGHDVAWEGTMCHWGIQSINQSRGSAYHVVRMGRNNAKVAVTAKGSHNPFDQWGSSISIQLDIYTVERGHCTL